LATGANLRTVDGQTVSCPYPVHVGDGSCYRLDVPSFVPPSYPAAVTTANEAAGRYFLPYVITSGRDFGKLPAGWSNYDFSVAFSFGTNRNVITTIQGNDLLWCENAGFADKPAHVVSQFFPDRPAGTVMYFEDIDGQRAIIRAGVLTGNQQAEYRVNAVSQAGLFLEQAQPSWYELRCYWPDDQAVPSFAISKLPATDDFSRTWGAVSPSHRVGSEDGTTHSWESVTFSGSDADPLYASKLEIDMIKGSIYVAPQHRIIRRTIGYKYDAAGTPQPINLYVDDNIAATTEIVDVTALIPYGSMWGDGCRITYTRQMKTSLEYAGSRAGSSDITQTIWDWVNLGEDLVGTYSYTFKALDANDGLKCRPGYVRCSNKLWLSSLIQTIPTTVRGETSCTFFTIDDGIVHHTATYQPYLEDVGTRFMLFYPKMNGSVHPVSGEVAVREGQALRWV
jgi:hypothetical protein